jgi:hypothetical protein
MSFLTPFVFGFLTACTALTVELIAFSLVDQESVRRASMAKNADFVFSAGGFGFLLLSAAIEEGAKSFALFRLRFTSWYLIVLFAFGFSGLEMFLLFSSAASSTITAEWIGIVAIHLATALLAGSSLHMAEILHRRPIPLLAVATMLAIGGHFFYNVRVASQTVLHI